MASAAFMIYKTIRQGSAPTVSTEISEGGGCNLVVFGLPAKLGDYMPDCFLTMTKHLSDPNIEIAALQKADLLKSAVKCGANRFLCIIIPPEMMKDKMITACKGVCPDVPVFGYGYEPKGRYQRDVDSHGEDLDAPCLHGPGVLRGNRGIWKPKEFAALVDLAKAMRGYRGDVHPSRSGGEDGSSLSMMASTSNAPLRDMGAMPGMKADATPVTTDAADGLKAMQQQWQRQQQQQHPPQSEPASVSKVQMEMHMGMMMEAMRQQMAVLQKQMMDSTHVPPMGPQQQMMESMKQQMAKMKLQMGGMAMPADAAVPKIQAVGSPNQGAAAAASGASHQTAGASASFQRMAALLLKEVVAVKAEIEELKKSKEMQRRMEQEQQIEELKKSKEMQWRMEQEHPLEHPLNFLGSYSSGSDLSSWSRRSTGTSSKGTRFGI